MSIAAALAVILAATPVTFPPPAGPVVDAAQLVPAAVEQRVEEGLLDFQQRSGITIAIAVVPTTAPLDAATYARDLAREWGLITDAFGRGVVLVVDAEQRRADVAVSLALTPAFPVAAQRDVLRVVRSAVRAGDESAALEAGATALRGALGDTTVVPVATTTSTLPAPRSSGGSALARVVAALGALAAVVAASVWVRRRRRDWGTARELRWGTGWGHAPAGPLAVLDRRYRRVRDAVHAAEAATGLRLCVWLGPTGMARVLADGLFARAAADGHASALVLLAMPSGDVELRVADEIGTGLTREVVGVITGEAPADALVVIAERIAGIGVVASGLGGVTPPELYR